MLYNVYNMIGALLQDRYQIDDELGRGGMGVVYRARDILLERDVAVKLLQVSAPGSEGSTLRARFLREAQAAARLNHPHIVAVHDAGETILPGTTTPLPFIVMELITGNPLDKVLPIPREEGLVIAHQICTALVEAHAAGIIHRDLKSENVLLTASNTVKLMDFGLAHLHAASQLTAEGTFMGTVAYMAPELIQGEPATIQSDLYAFGVLLYELAAGRQPFAANNVAALLSQHLNAPVVPPSTYHDGVPPALDRLILRLLSKRPAERPASATEVLRALEDLTRPELNFQPELPLLDRIARGRLVAREQETAVAKSLWQRAKNGDGQTLLVSGEPGIGKTRLVQELKVQAEINRGRTLWAECYAEGSAPYAPIMQLLTQLGQSGALTALDLPEYAANGLLTMAPALQPLFLDLSPTRLQDPQAEQQRLLDSVLTLLTLLAGQTPLLLVVDDVHWADSSSLNLLRYLARRGRSLRLLLVLTYREVELNEARALSELLFDLQRERLATQLTLNRLTLAQAGDLLATLFAEEITPEFLAGIYQETEGNPFFVEEVCKALIESGQLSRQDGRWQRPPDMAEMRIPKSVRLAIETRVTKLPETVQEVLRLAAIVGRRFEFDLLGHMTELDEDSLIEALEQAERAQLVQEVSAEGGGRFSFAHALIPTTLAEGLSGLRRRRLHRRVATVIEERNPHDYEALAHHYEAAAEREKAIHYLARAGDRAQQNYANVEAIAFYRAAITQMTQPEKQSHVPESESGQLSALYGKLGEILSLLGKADEALAAFDAALEYAPQTDTIGQARLHRQKGLACNTARQIPEMFNNYAQASAILGAPSPVPDPAWQMEWLDLQLDYAWAYYFSNRVAELNGMIAEVGPIIEQVGTPEQRYRFYETTFLADLRQYRFFRLPDETVARLGRQLATAEAMGDRRKIGRAKVLTGFCHLWRDELDKAERWFEASFADVERVGDMDTLIISRSYIALVERKRGNVVATRQLAERALALAQRLNSPFYISHAYGSLGWAAWREGDIVQAEMYLQEAQAAIAKFAAPNPVQFIMVGPQLAMAAAREDWETAVSHARVLLDSRQRKMADEVELVLQTAVTAWEDGRIAEAAAQIQNGITLLRQLGTGYV